jgi:hypothetical protein
MNCARSWCNKRSGTLPLSIGFLDQLLILIARKLSQQNISTGIFHRHSRSWKMTVTKPGASMDVEEMADL